MELNDHRVRKLERILRELLEIHAMDFEAPAGPAKMWLDLAIVETRSQLAKIQMKSVH